MHDKNIGVITEQGFVAGNGLGFNPIKESELNHSNKDDKNTSSNEDDNK